MIGGKGKWVVPEKHSPGSLFIASMLIALQIETCVMKDVSSIFKYFNAFDTLKVFSYPDGGVLNNPASDGTCFPALYTQLKSSS